MKASGEAPFDSFGSAVALVGDVNGDGVDDLLVGAPGAGVTFRSAGAAYLVSGDTGELLRTWRGAAADDQLGSAVCAAGDIDGDGIGDVLVGAPNYAGGAATGSAELRSAATGALLHRFIGPVAGSAFGAAVARLPDFTGDGISEFVVGAPADASYYVYDGSTHAELEHLQATQGGCNLGFSIAPLADVNGDGVTDLLVSAPFWHDTKGVTTGRLQLRSGADGAVLRTHYGEATGSTVDFYGWCVVVLDDVDGDGVRDYATGAWGRGSAQEGRVYLYSGATGAELRRIDGPARGDTFGLALGGGGDLDHDGFGDLLVGSPNHGATTGGRVTLLSGDDGRVLSVIDGSNDERLGMALAAAADLDQDGAVDLVAASIGAATSYRGAVGRFDCEAPTIVAMTPDRGDRDAATDVTIDGTALRSEAGFTVAVDGIVEDDWELTGTTRLAGTLASGAAGLVAIELRNAFGSTEARFKRTPAITVEGDFRPGGGGVWTSFVDPGDQLLLLAGLGPPVAIVLPKYDGALAILQPLVLWSDPSAAGDRVELPFDIDDDPSLVGLDVVAQTLAGPEISGRHADASFTNAVEIVIE